MHYRWLFAGVILGVSSAGCGLFGGEEDESLPMTEHGSSGATADISGGEDPTAEASSGPSDAPQPEPDQSIGPCAEGFTRSEIDDTIAIAEDFRLGVATLVGAQSAERALAGAVSYGVHEALLFESPAPAPQSWVFDGNGTYRWAVDGLVVASVFRFGADYTFAPANGRPAEDLLDPSVYLVSPHLDLGDGFPGPTATLTFDGVGPYVELLGLGTDPQPPLTLDGESTIAIRERGLMDLSLESDIDVDLQVFERTSIRYRATAPRATVRDVLPLEDPQLTRAVHLIEADIRDLNLERRLEVDEWDLSLASTPLIPELRGHVAFHVDAGYFPLRGTISYDDSNFGQVSMECG